MASTENPTWSVGPLVFRRSPHLTHWSHVVCFSSGEFGDQVLLPGRVWNMYLERTKRLAHDAFKVLILAKPHIKAFARCFVYERSEIVGKKVCLLTTWQLLL
jgi:hypothetical protein